MGFSGGFTGTHHSGKIADNEADNKVFIISISFLATSHEVCNP